MKQLRQKEINIAKNGKLSVKRYLQEIAKKK